MKTLSRKIVQYNLSIGKNKTDSVERFKIHIVALFRSNILTDKRITRKAEGKDSFVPSHNEVM